jgi:LuxR family maltose regulon positive regulatory protein
MDYLFTEVFSALSKDIQSFLLKTSVLDNLNASLCNAVAGISDSASILHHLFQSNLLLSSLDDPTEWYRYHHLMSDLLQQRLRLKMPELVPQLHARASQWYEKNQMAPQAIHHALSGGSFERAASLVENTNDSLILRGEVNTVIKWMDSFSEDIMSNRPYLCVLHATALLYSSGDIRLIEKRINQALVHKDNETIKGEIAAVRAMVALLKGDLKRSGAYLQESLAALSQDSILFRTIASANLALLHVWRGEIAPAITLFEGICKKGSDTGSIMMTVLASRRLASLFVMQAKLKEAKKVHEDVLLLARDSLGNPLPVAAYAYIGLGDLYREWDELDAALEYTNKGNELMKNWQEAGAMLGYIALSQVKAAQEDPDGATRAIESALRAAKEYKATEVDDILVEVYQARLNIRLGKLEAAAQWVQKREAMEPLFLNTEQQSETFYLREMELITLARYYLALGKNVGVIRIADYLIPAADKLGQVGIRIELLLIKALALFAQGKNHDAQVALEAALSLAEPSGYVRLFIDEGEAILKLLQQSAVRGISSRYATRLIAAFVGSRHKTTQRAAERREGVSPKEALSNRELEIIRLVGGGLSNKEISGYLFISIGTVKKHIYNICGKLNASNRTQAAARARELGLAEDKDSLESHRLT